MTKKVLVGLSGGVDSAVVAALLKQQGFDVTAGFMINYITEDDTCPTKIDMQVAKEVANFLDIPFYTFDFVQEYEKRIVSYIYDGYQKGITPNPDVLCNSLVKFGLFLDEALSLGFDAVATGHYAKITEKDELFHLWKGNDENKDQSYFLSGLSQYQLSHALFPLGDMPKSMVRKIALDFGLPNATRPDSQGICFIGKVGMKEFLAKKIPPKRGYILDIHGNVLGEHDGAWNFTIGQRKGIGVGGGPARFVVAKNIKQNTIVVGQEGDFDLFCREIRVSNWNWTGKSFPLPAKIQAKIRYRQSDQGTQLFQDEYGMFCVFDEPQRAAATGQILVAYHDNEVIGSGIIVQVQ